MSALKELVDLLKSNQKAASEQQKDRSNPNVDRFKTALTDSGSKGSEGLLEDDRPEKPEHWKALEAKHGKHLIMGRMLRAMAYGKKYGLGTGPSTCPKVIQDIYRDKALAKFIDLNLEKDLSAGVPTEGGYLVPEVTLDDMIELLRERCIIFKLGATELPMDEGNLNLGKQTDGATAYYLGENVAGNASDLDFGNVKMSAKKMFINVPISNDLLKTRSVKADLFVANDAVRAAKVKFDSTAFNSPGTSDEPRGLKYMEGLTSLSIAGAITADNLVNFFVKLFNAKVDLDDFSTVAWAFGAELWRDMYNAKATTNQYLLRDELKLGALLRYRYELTQFLARLSGGTAPMYFGAWSNFLIARQGLMEIDTSTEAAYNNSSGTVVSAWSKDQTLVRLIDRHDFAVRQGAAICRCTDITTAAA